jgi:hypothetical protein
MRSIQNLLLVLLYYFRLNYDLIEHVHIGTGELASADFAFEKKIQLGE